MDGGTAKAGDGALAGGCGVNRQYACSAEKPRGGVLYLWRTAVMFGSETTGFLDARARLMGYRGNRRKSRPA